MIRNIISGVIIGIANIIPGVSGGTVLLLLGLFDKTMTSISNIFDRKSKDKRKDLIFLAQIILGLLIGLVTFAKILEILFNNIPIQTSFWFSGMILFSIPLFIKKELKGTKTSKIYLILGILLILGLFLIAPTQSNSVITDFPEQSIVSLLILFFVGILGGASMIFPGISGSMMLLIVGKYYLIKSYIANITTLDTNILLPILFLGIGIIIGVVASAKITKYLLNKYKINTLSFILGLILMSSIMIIPLNETYNFITLVTSIIAFLFGGLIIYLLENKLKKSK
jgi:putative membrane protein